MWRETAPFPTYAAVVAVSPFKLQRRTTPECLEIISYRDMRIPPGDPGRDRLFNVTVYNRGALTLEALRRTVGDEDSYRILRTYSAGFHGGNAATGEFIRLSESTSRRDLDVLFDRWLYRPGLPQLSKS